MQQERGEIRVVAGCLFEVVLAGSSRWRWLDGGPEVTLLSEHRHDGRHRFRFRAEVAGAAAGSVELRFEGEGARRRSVVVSIAPERWPDPEPG